jgi:DNA-binding LytR/AlgR family response regulator
MKINCIAIDDEPLALQQIAGYIKKTPFLTLVATCKSAFEAMEIIADMQIDLMFVDIQMPDLTGIDFVKACGTGQKIIFTTAFEQYAIEGFKTEAIDYLLKPFGYEEFIKGAMKAKNYFELLLKAGQKTSAEDFIFVKSEYKLRKICLSNILYIEGLREYIKIVVNNDEPIRSLISMKLLEEKLPPESFMRVHRSFIVNLNHVNTIERGRIVFEKTYIPVSEQYKETFHKFLSKG